MWNERWEDKYKLVPIRFSRNFNSLSKIDLIFFPFYLDSITFLFQGLVSFLICDNGEQTQPTTYVINISLDVCHAAVTFPSSTQHQLTQWQSKRWENKSEKWKKNHKFNLIFPNGKWPLKSKMMRFLSFNFVRRSANKEEENLRNAITFRVQQSS